MMDELPRAQIFNLQLPWLVMIKILLFLQCLLNKVQTRPVQLP